MNHPASKNYFRDENEFKIGRYNKSNKIGFPFFNTFITYYNIIYVLFP